MTPEVCSIRDGYEELLMEYAATVLLAGTALNFADHRMKNAVVRLLPLATMYIRIVDGQCRHVPRYQKKDRWKIEMGMICVPAAGRVLLVEVCYTDFCNVTITLQLKLSYCTLENSLVRCERGIQPFDG